MVVKEETKALLGRTRANAVTASRPSVAMLEGKSNYLKNFRPRKPRAARQSDSWVPCNESSGTSQSLPPSLYKTSKDSEYIPSQKQKKKGKLKLGKSKAASRPTNNIKRKRLAMETLEHFDTTFDAQWYNHTDNAWSGHSQAPGDITFPRRFEDPDWNILNEWYWVNEKAPTSTLGMGEWQSLIRTEASSKRVSQELKEELKPSVSGPVIKEEYPVCPLCGKTHPAHPCSKCSKCMRFGHKQGDCEGVGWPRKRPTDEKNQGSLKRGHLSTDDHGMVLQ